MKPIEYAPLSVFLPPPNARPAITYRAARRNGLRTLGNRISGGTAASSYSDRHTRLETEQRLRAIKRAGQLPSPATREGAYVRALLAQLAPKVGPGKRSIHTLHRKIAIAEQRDYFIRKPPFNTTMGSPA